MESSTQSSFALHHLCQNCYVPAQSFCGVCRSAAYCSRKCQNLDWQSHKKFCLKDEDPETAIERRRVCLEKIQEGAIFAFLLRRQLHFTTQGLEGILVVEENRPTNFFVFSPFKVMQNLEFPIDKKNYDRLDFQIARAAHQERACISVYDCSDRECPGIYLLGSDQVDTLKTSVTGIPEEMLKSIFEQYILIRTEEMEPSERDNTYGFATQSRLRGISPMENTAFLSKHF